MDQAAKKSVAEMAGGVILKAHFPLSWSRDHFFTKGGHFITNPDYLIEPSSLDDYDKESFRLIDKWGKKLSEKSTKLNCGAMFDALAKSEQDLREYFEKRIGIIHIYRYIYIVLFTYKSD